MAMAGPGPGLLPGNSSQFCDPDGQWPIADARPRWAHCPRIEKDARERRHEPAGPDVNLTSYLPTTFTTLFVLAAGLLLGYIQ